MLYELYRFSLFTEWVNRSVRNIYSDLINRDSEVNFLALPYASKSEMKKSSKRNWMNHKLSNLEVLILKDYWKYVFYDFHMISLFIRRFDTKNIRLEIYSVVEIYTSTFYRSLILIILYCHFLLIYINNYRYYECLFHMGFKWTLITLFLKSII